LKAGRSSVGNLERINVADLGGNRTLIEGRFENIGTESRFIHRYAIKGQIQVLAFGVRAYKGNTIARQGFGSSGSDADFRYVNNEEPFCNLHSTLCPMQLTRDLLKSCVG